MLGRVALKDWVMVGFAHPFDDDAVTGGIAGQEGELLGSGAADVESASPLDARLLSGQ